MKNVRLWLVIAIVLTIIAGLVGIIVCINPSIERWYSYNSNITNVHAVYTETNETISLEDLESNLQSKKISYYIEGRKLYTDLFNYDVSNVDAVSIIKDQEFAKRFDTIDQRDFSKAKVEVDYKDSKRVETITYGKIKKINDQYYYYNYKVLLIYIFTGLFCAIFIFCLFMFKPRKHK